MMLGHVATGGPTGGWPKRRGCTHRCSSIEWRAPRADQPRVDKFHRFEDRRVEEKVLVEADDLRGRGCSGNEAVSVVQIQRQGFLQRDVQIGGDRARRDLEMQMVRNDDLDEVYQP